MAKKIKTKEDVIRGLEQECRELMRTKSDFRFIHNNFAVLLKPVAKIVRDGFVINLRYSDMYDHPFLDKQDSSIKTKVKPITFDEHQVDVSTREPGKLMYLLLHADNAKNGGSGYWLEDKGREAEDEYEFMKIQDEARELIKNSDEHQAKAAHYVLTGQGEHGMSAIEARVGLIHYSNDNPEKVIEAFEDEKTVYKFKLKTATILGYMYVTDNGTELRWGDTNGVILTIPAGTNMQEEFAKFCQTEKGKPVIERLSSELSK